MLKILLAGPIPPHPGGAAISLVQLASGFAKAGHQVSVVAPITEKALRGGDRAAAAYPELHIVRYLLERFDQMPFLPPSDAFLQEEGGQVSSLVEILLTTFAPDLLVVGRESFARYLPDALFRLGVPSVLLVRGNPLGHILRGAFPKDETERILTHFRKVDRIITVAQFQADGLRGLGFDNVTHIHNAIDLPRFAPRPRSGELLQRLDINPDSIVVLVPGNLHQRKRPVDVVNSAAVALRQNARLMYVMAGSGVLRDELEGLCEALGVSGRFRFLDWVEYDQMPALMNAADIVLLASDSEGMARVYLEAMASERLLLASDIPSARELITDGVNGLLFRMGDVSHLAARTLEAAANPSMRDEIGRRARADVQPFNLTSAVSLYLREFADVVAESAQRARRF